MANLMKRYEVNISCPVSGSASAVVEVEASSEKEALKLAREKASKLTSDDYEIDDYNLEVNDNDFTVEDIESETSFTEEEQAEWEEQQETIKNEELFRLKYNKTPQEMIAEHKTLDK